jgi:crotonobetainyl-CoA:carnitine CoA-transferase CaiB-like acyl-CoA transferase
MLHGTDEPGHLPIDGDAACYNVYATADGRHVALAAIEQKFWRTFCERVGRPDFVAIQFALSEQARLREETAAIFRSRSLADWLSMFADAEVCLAPVNTIGEALADPHLALRGAVTGDGRSMFVRSPIVFGHRGTSPRRDDERLPIEPARPLGADTDDVFRSVGVDDAALARLRSAGVV